jgi:hypothetical protein
MVMLSSKVKKFNSMEWQQERVLVISLTQVYNITGKSKPL